MELPEGTEVAVSILPLSDTEQPDEGTRGNDVTSLPFFGMWADREGMQDSTASIRRERERWQQRTARQD
jgi:hypothetical protein